MKDIFDKDYRYNRPKADGSPGFVDVKKGHAPEEYGIAIEDCAGLLTVEVSDSDVLEFDIHVCIQQMIETDPDQKDPELWTVDKKPKVRVIEGVIKQDITEADRDEAWEQYIREVNDNG